MFALMEIGLANYAICHPGTAPSSFASLTEPKSVRPAVYSLATSPYGLAAARWKWIADIVPACADLNFRPRVTELPSSIGLFGTALPKY